MWTLFTCFLGSIVVVRTESSIDSLQRKTIYSVDFTEMLQRFEKRQIDMVMRLESIEYFMDLGLRWMDDEMLQLNRELSRSRLDGTVAEGLQTANSSAPEERSLAAALRHELCEAKKQLHAQLNESHDRLATLLAESRVPVDESKAAQTTVIMEKCSYRDQIQTADQWRPADCAAVQQRHQRSGIYTIYPTSCGNDGGLRVFCDLDTDGGGWTVLMRRTDVPVHQDFDMGWEAYKWGFGNLSGEFWLGNEYINLMTSTDQMQLLVDLRDWANQSRTALYTPFSVGSEQQKYVLKVGKYSGNAGDALTSQANNMQFSTKDADNDVWHKHCAVHHNSAWWHRSCMQASLTSPYKSEAIKKSGATWYRSKRSRYYMKHVEMKMRPVNYMTWCHKLAREGARDSPQTT